MSDCWITVAVRASAPPLIAFALLTERPSGSPSILIIVRGSVFPSAPGVTETTSASAWALPTLLTAFWVAYFFPGAVLTIHPFGVGFSQNGKGEPGCVNVTVPPGDVASIGFSPGARPG